MGVCVVMKHTRMVESIFEVNVSRRYDCMKLDWAVRKGWLAMWKSGLCIIEMIPVHTWSSFCYCYLLKEKSIADLASLLQYFYRGFDLLLVPITLSPLILPIPLLLSFFHVSLTSSTGTVIP